MEPKYCDDELIRHPNHCLRIWLDTKGQIRQIGNFFPKFLPCFHQKIYLFFEERCTSFDTFRLKYEKNTLFFFNFMHFEINTPYVFPKPQSLVGGFNPSEKYWSNWVHFPQVGVKMNNIWNHHQVNIQNNMYSPNHYVFPKPKCIPTNQNVFPTPKNNMYSPHHNHYVLALSSHGLHHFIRCFASKTTFPWPKAHPGSISVVPMNFMCQIIQQEENHIGTLVMCL